MSNTQESRGTTETLKLLETGLERFYIFTELPFIYLYNFLINMVQNGPWVPIFRLQQVLFTGQIYEAKPILIPSHKRSTLSIHST